MLPVLLKTYSPFPFTRVCVMYVCVFASLCGQEGTRVHVETKVDVGNYSQSLFQFSGAGPLSRAQSLLVDATSQAS